MLKRLMLMFYLELNIIFFMVFHIPLFLRLRFVLHMFEIKYDIIIYIPGIIDSAPLYDGGEDAAAEM